MTTPIHHDHHHADPPAPSASLQKIAACWLLVSVSILLLAVTGREANYVKSFWQPVLIVVASAVALLAGITLWRGRSHYQSPHAVSPVTWLALIPTLLLVVSAPSPLGASMLSSTTQGETSTMAGGQTARVTKAQPINYPQLSATSSNELGLDELSDRYYFGDTKALEGKPVTVIGFVSHPDASGSGESSGDGAGFAISRYKIFCCAADAVSYTTLVTPTQAGAPQLANDTWVEVTGTITTSGEDPGILADTITPISQPKVPYL